MQDLTIATLLALAPIYLGAMSAVGFVVFAWDKHCARNDMWRVPERSLLTLAAIGAAAGMIIGQRILRHKTRKEPFRTYLLLIAAAQIVGLPALLIPEVRIAAGTIISDQILSN